MSGYALITVGGKAFRCQSPIVLATLNLPGARRAGPSR